MKYLFLTILLNLSASSAWSQVEFAPLGAEWYYRYNPGYFSANTGGFSHVQYIGDTLLGGLVCKQMCTTNFIYSVSSVHCSGYSNIDFIYQKADSVFRYESYSTEPIRFLFRNNFQLGDTLQKGFGRQWVVTEILPLDFNNSTVRRFRLEDNGGYTFIYDVFGPESGILEHLPGEITDGPTFDLRCYSDAGFPQINLTAEACDAIMDAPKPKFTVSISPNPAHDMINLLFKGFLSEPPNIKLWDALGRLVLEERFDFGQNRLSVRNLPAGFYELTAEVDGTIIQQKLIKY